MTEEEKLEWEIEEFCEKLKILFSKETKDEILNERCLSNEISEKTDQLKQSEERLRQLRSARRNFNRENDHELENLCQKQIQLKDRLMEAQFRMKIGSRYANNWKTSHIDQWTELCIQIEDELRRNAENQLKINRQTEEIHQETVRILTKERNDVERESNRFHEKYINETERFEQELIHFRNEFFTVKQQRRQLEDQYERMTSIVNEYQQEQIEKERLGEQRKREEQSILKIQAWWRGTMSRHLKRRKYKKRRRK